MGSGVQCSHSEGHSNLAEFLGSLFSWAGRPRVEIWRKCQSLREGRAMLSMSNGHERNLTFSTTLLLVGEAETQFAMVYG